MIGYDDLYARAFDQLCYSFYDRINHHNKNFIGFTTGESGGGKTWMDMRIAWKVDKTFRPSTHMTWTAKEFMELLESGKMGKGNMIVSDESGIAIPKRDWYSIFNKKINAVLQTFRHENIGVLFIAPTLKDFLDSQTQKLLQFYFEVTGINETERYTIVKPRKVEVNRITGKLYFKRPKINVDGMNIWLGKIRIPAPPQDLIDEYEQIARERKLEIKHEGYMDILEAEERSQPKEDKLTMINRMADEAMAKGMTKPTIYSIVAEFGCSDHIARVVCAKINHSVSQSHSA
jgi:hypothetical protein